MEAQEENKINSNTNESQDKNEILPQKEAEVPQNEIKENPPQQNQKVFTKPSERAKTKVIFKIKFYI
jgi:hypothetical protein